MDAPSLSGTVVLVTRPAAQSSGLVDEVRRLGGAVVVQPLLEIEAAGDTAAASWAARLDEFDILVFVSRNAVLYGLDLVAACGRSLPGAASVAAVGPATAAALDAAGVDAVACPQGASNSEELLNLPLFESVSGRRILIFRGQDGRELLAASLRRRGATVEYAAVYRRVAVGVAAWPVVGRWLDAIRPVLVLTSVAALDSLLGLVPGSHRQRLLRVPAAVIGARVAAACRHAGWQGPLAVATGAGDAELAAAAAAAIHPGPAPGR